MSVNLGGSHHSATMDIIATYDIHDEGSFVLYIGCCQAGEERSSTYRTGTVSDQPTVRPLPHSHPARLETE